MRYLELNNNTVVNIILWDGVQPYEPNGFTLVVCDDAPGVSYGWRLVDGEWVEPEATAAPISEQGDD